MENNDNLSKYSLNNFTINKSDEDFEDIIKNKNVILKQSGNVFEDIILTIDERKNSITSGKLAQVAYHYSGFDDKDSYLKNIEKLHNKLLELNNLYVYYDGSIHIRIDEYITREVSNLLEGKGPQINKGDIEKFIENDTIYNITNSSVINGLVKEAFNSILKDYIKNEPGVNISKVKNF